jgi:hypothetical protein
MVQEEEYYYLKDGDIIQVGDEYLAVSHNTMNKAWNKIKENDLKAYGNEYDVDMWATIRRKKTTKEEIEHLIKLLEL